MQPVHTGWATHDVELSITKTGVHPHCTCWTVYIGAMRSVVIVGCSGPVAIPLTETLVIAIVSIMASIV